jgi:hypothetical protein
MIISANLSIHNRGKLFKRALLGYLWQTLPRKDWEIVLVDDMSTEDLSQTYKDLIGEINLRHVHFDHKKHAMFREMNPKWEPGQPENWYHTPALSLNLGAHLSRGEFLAVCHPEILHAPDNFEKAAVTLTNNPKQFLFGATWLGSYRNNLLLEQIPDWREMGWDHFIAAQNRPYHLHCFNQNELYWYTSFLPRQAFVATRGVEFDWMRGVAGEDDCFRDCVKMAGYMPVYRDDIQGFHQDHSDEKEAHRDRSGERWKLALERNRTKYYEMREGRIPYPFPANPDYDWTARECIVKIIDYKVGSKEAITSYPIACEEATL